MGLYRSPEQTDLHTIYVSAKFSALRFFVYILKPCPLAVMLLTHHEGLNWIFIEGHQRNISAKLYWNRSSSFWQKDFKVFYIAIEGKKSPDP